MMRPHHLAALLLGTALTVGSTAGLAQQPQGGAPSKEALDEARTRYERGTQLYGEGDYKLAIIEFNRAYELAPNYKVLFNIGQVNLQLGNYAAARRAFEQYLKEGGQEMQDKRRAEVEKELVSLKNRTAHITVVTDVEGAEITIDGNPVGVTPLQAPLLVDAGQHTVAAKKSGRMASSRAVTLAGTDEIKIEFELPAEATPVTANMVSPIREKETIIQQGKASYVWVPWVITGVLAAGATVTGVFALTAGDDLEAERDAPIKEGQSLAQKREDVDNAQSKARNLAITTDVLAGSAVVAGAIAIIFTVSEANSSEKTGNHRPSNIRVGVGPGSVALAGKF